MMPVTGVLSNLLNYPVLQNRHVASYCQKSQVLPRMWLSLGHLEKISKTTGSFLQQALAYNVRSRYQSYLPSTYYVPLVVAKIKPLFPQDLQFTREKRTLMIIIVFAISIIIWHYCSGQQGSQYLGPEKAFWKE